MIHEQGVVNETGGDNERTTVTYALSACIFFLLKPLIGPFKSNVYTVFSYFK